MKESSRYIASLIITMFIFGFIFLFTFVKENTIKKVNIISRREILLTKYDEYSTKILKKQTEKTKSKINSYKNSYNTTRENSIKTDIVKIKTIKYYPNFEVDYMPVYPSAAKRMRQQGSVELYIYVDENGNIAKIVVNKSSGYKLLDDAAINGVRKWDYTKFLDKDSLQYKIMTKISFKLL